MVPTIRPGDLVLLQKVDPSKLRVGDIICYDALSQKLDSSSTPITPYPIMHRINQIVIENGARYFVTKGDNNPSPDDWYVPQDAVVGKAILIIPYMGKVFTFLSQLDVKIPAIVAILAIIALWPTKKKDTKQNKNKEVKK